MWYIHTRSRELEPSPQKNSKRLYYDYMVIFVFYMTICVLPLVHRTSDFMKDAVTKAVPCYSQDAGVLLKLLILGIRI